MGGFRGPNRAALRDLDGEKAILERLGVVYDAPDTGCCGMAGSLGFERGHYDVSVAVGERVLLPAVRQAPRDTLIVTDGFSCREQIAQTTPRRALHLADVLRMALREGPHGPPGDRPERHYTGREEDAVVLDVSRVAAVAVCGVAAGAALAWVSSRRGPR